jgi:4'-phosphopantetheinyl transferase
MIGSGRADVWLVEVDDPHFLAMADSGLATEADQARAASMIDPRTARSLLARRATLRLILARYVEEAPAGLKIVTAPGGKPVLTHGPAFSVAHSGALYAVAVNDASSVGVDVERERSVDRAAAIAGRWFSEEEADQLARVPEDGQEEEFLRIWCAKEALAKRHGAGLRLMKGRGAGSDGALDVGASLSDGRLCYFDARPGYVACLASTDPVTEINVIHPPEDLWTT